MSQQIKSVVHIFIAYTGQRRPISAYAFAQSDQSFRYPLTDSSMMKIELVYMYKISDGSAHTVRTLSDGIERPEQTV